MAVYQKANRAPGVHPFGRPGADGSCHRPGSRLLRL